MTTLPVQEFEIKRIEELCSKVTSGGTPSRKNPEYYTGRIPWIKTGELTGWFIKGTSEKITKGAIAKSSAKVYPRSTVLMAMYGDGKTIGSTGITDVEAASNQACCAMIPDPEKVDPLFLLYSLKLNRETIVKLALGGAQRNLNQGTIKNYELRVPSLENQRIISKALSNYDYLIENNNRRIAILEEMAQSLYLEWFVKFRFPGYDQCQMVESPLGLIPEGWEVKTIKESMELAYGKALKKADRKGGEVAVYGSGGIGGFHNTALVNGPCIIVGRKGNVGSIFWCEHDCWPIDTVFYVKSAHSKYYLYFNLLHQTFHNSDAAVPGLNRESAYSNKLILPETEVVAKFDEIIDPMFSQLKNLRAKNENLRKQRDLLLPKLISGQIDLSQVEQATA